MGLAHFPFLLGSAHFLLLLPPLANRAAQGAPAPCALCPRHARLVPMPLASPHLPWPSKSRRDTSAVLAALPRPVRAHAPMPAALTCVNECQSATVSAPSSGSVALPSSPARPLLSHVAMRVAIAPKPPPWNRAPPLSSSTALSPLLPGFKRTRASPTSTFTPLSVANKT